MIEPYSFLYYRDLYGSATLAYPHPVKTLKQLASICQWINDSQAYELQFVLIRQLTPEHPQRVFPRKAQLGIPLFFVLRQNGVASLHPNSPR
jgi:hypothetical protein